MFVAGIDLSSKSVDIVKVPFDENAVPIAHTFPLGKGGTAFDRARNVAVEMPGRTSSFWDDVLAVGIEEPYGKGLLSTAAGYRVQGAILSCIPISLLVQPLAPTVWKKAVGIGGNATKPEIADWVTTRAPHSATEWVTNDTTQDIMDAYAIGYATMSLLE